MTDVAANLRDRLGLRVPVIAAPMAGGPSTPELARAVSDAGGLGFLAGGYRSADDLAAQIGQLRERTDGSFGVNLFVPGEREVDQVALSRYAARLAPDATRLGVELGVPRWDDDDYPAKVAVVAEARVPLVSFTFGCPSAAEVSRLHRADCLVAVTITTVAEAVLAHRAGADVLVVQGSESGGHRGTFREQPGGPPGAGALPLRELLDAVRRAVPLPLIAAGGLMTGGELIDVLASGAVAAQLGTAFLCCPEAGTVATHRRALREARFTATGFTRAFTGRTARGLVNDFFREHDAVAPAAYPWVHHLTRPVRQAAATQGDADRLHLWAGEGWQRIRPMPAADLVARLADELRG